MESLVRTLGDGVAHVFVRSSAGFALRDARRAVSCSLCSGLRDVPSRATGTGETGGVPVSVRHRVGRAQRVGFSIATSNRRFDTMITATIRRARKFSTLVAAVAAYSA